VDQRDCDAEPLVHEYFGIDLEEVWSTAVNDLPLLQPKVMAMLEEAG
jgi:uncharacterized protein with HEPN domain